MAVLLKDNVKPISYIKSNAAAMLSYVNERKTPMIITQNGEARAVVMDIDTYQGMEDAFALLGIIKLSEDAMAKGLVYPVEEVFEEIRKEIDEIQKENDRNA